MQSFFHGFILAWGLILPLGVQNLFVFNQGAAKKDLCYALPAAAAAAVCDTVMILFAVQGVSLLLFKISLLRHVLIGAGILLLLYMGLLTWRGGEAKAAVREMQGLSIRQQVLFAISVSILNPHALLDTVAVIGTSAISYEGQEKVLFTGACIMVSWLWFLGLVLLGRILGRTAWFYERGQIINRISALFIWGSACYMAFTAL